MSNPLVYLDQSVVGLLLSERKRLDPSPELTWVYSKEHFAEIRRAADPMPYLAVLERVGARLLDLEIGSDWKITGRALLVEEGAPQEHYEAYVAANDDVSFDESVLDPMQAWINGGGDKDSLVAVPDRLAEQLVALLDQVADGETASLANAVVPEFRSAIDHLASRSNDIGVTRAAFGVGKGRAGSVASGSPIDEIWKIIGPRCAGVSCDQFFGFEALHENSPVPLYLGIVSCCAVLDIVGFQAEKKCRKITAMPNVRSDSVHIAMGAFCAAVLTNDKRLASRAAAIYRYKGITTAVLPLGVTV